MIYLWCQFYANLISFRNQISYCFWKIIFVNSGPLSTRSAAGTYRGSLAAGKHMFQKTSLGNYVGRSEFGEKSKSFIHSINLINRQAQIMQKYIQIIKLWYADIKCYMISRSKLADLVTLTLCSQLDCNSGSLGRCNKRQNLLHGF